MYYTYIEREREGEREIIFRESSASRASAQALFQTQIVLWLKACSLFDLLQRSKCYIWFKYIFAFTEIDDNKPTSLSKWAWEDPQYAGTLNNVSSICAKLKKQPQARVAQRNDTSQWHVQYAFTFLFVYWGGGDMSYWWNFLTWKVAVRTPFANAGLDNKEAGMV